MIKALTNVATAFQGANDFSLEDLPPGHPIITRENLEEIGEYSFTTLRGLVFLGGQARIDPELLRDAVASAAASTDAMVGGEFKFALCILLLHVLSNGSLNS